MKLSKQFILVAFITASLFLIQATAALGQQTPSQVIHEADAANIVKLNVGDTIQFSLDENVPNTTRWGNPLIVWTDVANSIQETTTGILYDFTQTPSVVKGMTFNYYGVQAGQTVLLFYKNAITSTTNPDGSTTTVLADSIHPMVKAVTFIVNVNDPNAQ